MKYIARWLPVNGKLNIGDVTKWPVECPDKNRLQTVTEKNIGYLQLNDCCPYKRFMVYKHLEVGDPVTVLQFNTDPNWNAIIVDIDNGNYILQGLNDNFRFSCPYSGMAMIVVEVPDHCGWITEGMETENWVNFFSFPPISPSVMAQIVEAAIVRLKEKSSIGMCYAIIRSANKLFYGEAHMLARPYQILEDLEKYKPEKPYDSSYWFKSDDNEPRYAILQKMVEYYRQPAT